MRPKEFWDVEKTRKLRPGALLLGLAIFGMLVLLVTGNVRLYRLRQENEVLEEEIQELEESANQQQWKQQALDLGLQTPTPDQTVILHLRGGMG